MSNCLPIEQISTRYHKARVNGEMLIRLYFQELNGQKKTAHRKDLESLRRLFIYSESNLTDDEILQLKKTGRELGHVVQFRSDSYVIGRTQFEAPLAFVSHDSRDKETVARKIAINLERMLCPVWYDEFSLKVGDNLRESIEKGLKECRSLLNVMGLDWENLGEEEVCRRLYRA